MLQGEKRVTPAGRYTLKVAPSSYAGGKAFELVESEHRVGNTDYVIAVHAAYLGDKTEKREERLATAAVSDKRISYGCINTKSSNRYCSVKYYKFYFIFTHCRFTT